jgi:hypothetical protein
MFHGREHPENGRLFSEGCPGILGFARGVGEPIAPALELTADPTVLEGDENVAKLVFDQFE